MASRRDGLPRHGVRSRRARWGLAIWPEDGGVGKRSEEKSTGDEGESGGADTSGVGGVVESDSERSGLISGLIAQAPGPATLD